MKIYEHFAYSNALWKVRRKIIIQNENFILLLFIILVYGSTSSICRPNLKNLSSIAIQSIISTH